MNEQTPDGLHAERLAPNRENPREVSFSAQWKQEHQYRDLLAQLLQVPCNKGEAGSNCDFAFGGYWKRPLGEPTERDRIVAATVVQWLGSNCGFGMVREAMEKCGYKVERPLE